MMASQQSNITSTPTPTSTPAQMLLPKSTTAIGMTTSNANPTVSTTTPVITDNVQKCVDTAAEATTSPPTTTAGMTSTQIASTKTTSTTTTTKTATSSSNTVPTMAKEAHRYHTMFVPITLVESLTKTNLLLVADVKSELQSMNKQLSKQSAENLETRMEALEQGFIELREVVMQRTINNHLKPNPELLEVWDPSMMVLEKSNWTNMRLILNKTAEDNYPDLFPSEWDHQKLFTEMHEMHYKVFSEVMTTFTQKRGYNWIVFNRLPDKISSNTTTTLCSDTEEEDGDFSLTSKDGVHIRNRKNDQAISGENQHQNQKQMNPTRNDVLFSVPRQENTDEEVKPTGNTTKGKTYCYKYFRPYKNDWRLLLTNDSGESIGCTCPKARIHNKKCVWYNPNHINIPDTRNDLSISEKAAQGKIYVLYQNTQNGQQEPCGCGTAAEIAYMGHKSNCEEFQWIHERGSYEWLLANLQKSKKITLFDNIQQQHKRPRLQSPSGNGKNEAIPKDTKTDVNMDNPGTSATPITATNSLAVLVEISQSHSSQSSLSDLIDEQNGGTGGADCPFAEEMPPLEDADSTDL